MNTLGRQAGYLALASGALLTVLAVIVGYDPNTSAWFAFFLVIVLLGAAVIGFERCTREATGRLGRASAWLSIGGAVALLAVFAYGLVTGQLMSSSLNPAWAVTVLAWFLGIIGFSVAITRARVLSGTGGWLVLAGAVVGVGTSVVPPDAPYQAVLVPVGLVLFGVGWILVGYAATRAAPVWAA